MQSHLSLVLIPFFTAAFWGSTVWLMCPQTAVHSADGDKQLDAITMVSTSTAIITAPQLPEGLKMIISLFAHTLKHTFNTFCISQSRKCDSNDWSVIAEYRARCVSNDYRGCYSLLQNWFSSLKFLNEILKWKMVLRSEWVVSITSTQSITLGSNQIQTQLKWPWLWTKKKERQKVGKTTTTTTTTKKLCRYKNSGSHLMW